LRVTVADQIAEWLAEKEIRHAFGIIGAGNLALFDAISRKAKTQIVCCHHEQAAVMAAGFSYRMGGRIAVALCTTGAGSSNALTGVLAAFMDSTPLLVISGNEPSKYLGARTRVLGVQGYDSTAVAYGITKSAVRLTEKPLRALEIAYWAALKPRMGPVWVDIPRDIQVQNV